MTKREQALAIVDNYSVYHAGTALAVGAFGGQFGADTVALTALTIKMIEEICNVYGIRERKAKNIHIASAIARLTYKGTVIAKTILNWLPLGSVANSATTYFLTRSAGLKCIDEIERNKMNVQDQLVQGLKDAAVTIVKSELCDNIEHLSDHLSENVIDNVKETLQCDISQDIGLDNIITYLDKIPTEATAGIDKAVGTALKASLAESLKGNVRKFNSAEVLSKTILASLSIMVEEHTKMSEAEIQFRIMKNDEHYKTFETFLHNTADYYDKLEQERGIYEALKYCISGISDGCKVYFGLTSKDMLNKILDNPYDKKIESTYSFYLPLISISDNYESIYAKASMLYNKLCMINFEFNVPQTSSEKKDDKLIYMVAERIQENTELLKVQSTEVVAYELSQNISKNAIYLTTHISTPIIIVDDDIWRNEYERIRTCHISFWIEIIKNSKTEQGAWTDCVMLYFQLQLTKQIFHGQIGYYYKDDDLIYNIAEIMQPQIPIMRGYTVAQVAYFIAESYDKIKK